MTELPKINGDFAEVAHSGGKFGFKIRTDKTGAVYVQVSVTSRCAGPVSLVGIRILFPQGIPVGITGFAGISEADAPPGEFHSIPIMMASDNQGKFGHECPLCKEHWRSDGPSPGIHTCPYCGNRSPGHAFLTAAQKKYVRASCEVVSHGLANTENGDILVDMDEISDRSNKDGVRPSFYYAERSQQKQFTCKACGAFNDVLGRYVYCFTCGTHNGLNELKEEISRIRTNFRAGEYENCVRDSIAAFDSYCRSLTKQFVNRIPMVLTLRRKWERQKFHQLSTVASLLKDQFDISLFKGMSKEDSQFAVLTFHRRHVYEHNGGEADEKYIRDSGDSSVRPKQSIRETNASADRISEIILKMGQNFYGAFHELFPPECGPIQIHLERQKG